MGDSNRGAWIIAVIILLAVAVVVTVTIVQNYGEGAGICIEGGEPPHCAGPGGPRRDRS